MVGFVFVNLNFLVASHVLGLVPIGGCPQSFSSGVVTIGTQAHGSINLPSLWMLSVITKNADGQACAAICVKMTTTTVIAPNVMAQSFRGLTMIPTPKKVVLIVKNIVKNGIQKYL